MKIVLTLLLMISLPLAAFNGTYRGYVPLMLSDVAAIKSSTLPDRVLLAQSQKGWVNLTSLLTTDEQVLFPELKTKKLWVDLCQPANIKLLNVNVHTWLKQQPWYKNISLTGLKISAKSNRICKAWENVQDFTFNRAVMKADSIELSATDVSSHKVMVRLTGNYSVPVSERDIAAGDNVQDADWRYQRQSIAGVRVSELAWFSGSEWNARIKIKKNRVIKPHMVAISPAVNYGDTVTVHFLNALVEINTVARALGKGQLGDSVMVLIEGAKTPVLSKITAKGVVKIEA
jgi:flagella basal body P-ring formation protein FlgA